MTRPPKSKTIERLQKVLNEIPELKNLSTDSSEFKKWIRTAKVTISNAFTGEPYVAKSHLQEFIDIGYEPYFDEEYGFSMDDRSAFWGGLDLATAILESMIEEVKEYWEDEDEMKVSASPPKDEPIDTTKVFVVHGRDDSTRQAVARFIEKLDLEPVILNEQADKGRTIIEKFEQEAEEVRFAVILLTPDDEGRLRSEEAELRPRARQNVIFELGYFRRALGPNRVCALKKGEVETPSDYEGVIYISLDDAGGWKMGLIRELKAAGFDVDANRAL